MAKMRIWDVPTRTFHGLLGAAVAGAWLTAGDARWLHLHVLAGTLAAALTLFRVLWGFIGGPHARFRAFLRGPRDVRAHIHDLLAGTAHRPAGHDPLAGWAMVAAMALVLLLAVTGVWVLGGEEGQGPLGGVLSVGQGIALHGPHGALSLALLCWLGLHLAGVVLASLRHGEALPLAMVTGRKRAVPGAPSSPAHRGVALLLVGAIAGGALWSARGVLAGERPYAGRALPDDPEWRSACGECHLAYPPHLLPARSWTALMDGQADHFGEDLGLEAEPAARVERFLTSHAAEREVNEAAWYVAHTTPPAETPLRVTALPWWRERHPVPDDDAGRCGDCHADAEAGTFVDGAMTRKERSSR